MGNVLYVAAGGGGDVIGAAMVDRAFGGSAVPQIATFSWDRLLVDPVPGPRDATWFDHLRPIGGLNHQVTAATTIRRPAGSSLPRLARELPAALYLLDPNQGAVGLSGQLLELTEQLQASSICVVDIGGDILARGNEDTLRSPLADSLIVAALADHPLEVSVVVAGAGLDGELAPGYVLERLAELGARPCGRVQREHALKFAAVFEWHPSEASGLLASAAMGARGRVEMQAGHSTVELTPDSSALHSLALLPLSLEGSLAAILRCTTSLESAQQGLVGLGLRSELEYERSKASHLQRGGALDSDSLLEAADNITADKAAREIDMLTLRRLAETLGLSSKSYVTNLACLKEGRPWLYCPPVWIVNQEAWPRDLRPFRGHRNLMR